MSALCEEKFTGNDLRNFRKKLMYDYINGDINDLKSFLQYMQEEIFSRKCKDRTFSYKQINIMMKLVNYEVGCKIKYPTPRQVYARFIVFSHKKLKGVYTCYRKVPIPKCSKKHIESCFSL